MPNTRSAKKRLRQNRRRAARNKAFRTRLRTMLKKTRAAAGADEAAALYRKASSLLDHAVSRGVVHRNVAARHKARLAVRARAVGAKI